MDFFVNGIASGKTIESGVVIEGSEQSHRLQAGSSIRLVFDATRRETAIVEAVGYLKDGQGQTLKDDLVADINLSGQRFGMRHCGAGQLGPLWVIVGAPYEEPLAPQD